VDKVQVVLLVQALLSQYAPHSGAFLATIWADERSEALVFACLCSCRVL
jgi:hypothetical protein